MTFRRSAACKGPRTKWYAGLFFSLCCPGKELFVVALQKRSSCLDFLLLDIARALLKDAPMLIRNTVGYNLLFMVVGVILQVGLAVIINEMRNRKTAKVYHTIAFMPYFVSWIVVMYALYAMISFSGFFNQVGISLGHEPIKYYSQKQYWPWIFLIANIWKYTGQGSIIYLATLTGFWASRILLVSSSLR